MTGVEAQRAKAGKHQWAIVLHGGAGVIDRATMAPKTEAAYRASLTEAIEAGAKFWMVAARRLMLSRPAIRILEDDPLFNAGRGADFAADGRNELDAAMMDGCDPAGGRGGRRYEDAASDQPGARGDGKVSARIALRRGGG